MYEVKTVRLDKVRCLDIDMDNYFYEEEDCLFVKNTSDSFYIDNRGTLKVVDDNRLSEDEEINSYAGYAELCFGYSEEDQEIKAVTTEVEESNTLECEEGYMTEEEFFEGLEKVYEGMELYMAVGK